MYNRDWMDELSWIPVLIGVFIAMCLQVSATFLVIIPFNIPLDWVSVILVELCIAIGAFITSWRAKEARLINGIATALICAVISLIVTAARTPADLNIWTIVFLFGTFGVMGAIGGLIASRLPTRDNTSFSQQFPVRRVGR